jgi:hypothetical protein
MRVESDEQTKRDDKVRSLLVMYTTIQAFALIVFFGIAPFVHFHIASDEALGVIEVVLPILTGYIGLMLGFYYGGKEGQR